MFEMLPLAYNSNLHPAETCAELIASLESFALPLREALGWDTLGVDFRIGSQAIAELQDPRKRDQLRRCIDQSSLSTHSLNGFPLSPFQVAVVKDQAYNPDWCQRQRLEESIQLIDCALALCDQDFLSISTVPGTWKPWGVGSNVVQQIAENIGEWLAAAAISYRKTARRVQLAIEPEPWCLLEHSQEVLAFWTGPLREWAIPACAALLDNDTTAAEKALVDHLGICFDTCHLSLAFEGQVAVVQKYRNAGIPIAKCQFSAALEITNPHQQPDAVAVLATMDEARFLHQTAAITEQGSVLRVSDLDQLAQCVQRLPTARSIRSHFHVPVFWPSQESGLSTTIEESKEGLAACVAAGVDHIAVETYTWSVLADNEQDALAGTIREMELLSELVSAGIS